MTGLLLIVWRELHSGKVFYVVLAVTTFYVWKLGLQTDVRYIDGVAQEVRMYGKVSSLIELHDDYNAWPFILLFLAIAAAGGVVPHLMRRGRIELLHSKPLTRTKLLLNTFLAVSVATSLIFIYFFGGVWIATGLRTGVWYTVLLLGGFLWILMCAVISAVVVLAGVIAGKSLLATTFSWFACLIIPSILEVRDKLLYPLFESDLARWGIDRLYDTVPQIPKACRNIADLIVHGDFSALPLIQSIASGCAVLILAALIFRRKSF
jgi:ABC-type transport system involved in multi-copper enzyme maturation permease subunit